MTGFKLGFARLARGAAWLGIVLSALVHVASWFGFALWREFAFLHIGIFIFFIPAAASKRNRQKPRMRWPPQDPPWATKAIQIAGINALVHFAAFFWLAEGGGAQLRDGHYLLLDHGKLIRELTAHEYAWQMAHEARSFSAGWLLFYLFLLVWYWRPETAFAPAAPT